jgi:preprotein translocase subunit SecA
MVRRLMDRLKIPEDVPIEAKMVSKAIERAQHQVESRNFEIRKNVLKYDDVINKQREVIYEERNKILDGASLRDNTVGFIEDVVRGTVAEFTNAEIPPEEWDLDGLFTQIKTIYHSELSKESFDLTDLTTIDLEEAFLEEAMKVYEQRESEIGEEEFRDIERRVLLSVLDNRWREHLYEMDYLQEGIGLRAIAQRDPLVEYQREGFGMFEAMLEGIKEDFVRYIFHLQVVREERPPEEKSRDQQARWRMTSSDTPEPTVAETARSDKIPRNAPCPCGSGKKYKKCHGANAPVAG